MNTQYVCIIVLRRWNSGTSCSVDNARTLDILRGAEPTWEAQTGVCRSEGKWPSRQSNYYKRLVSRKCWGAWDTTWHKAKEITPSVGWRRERDVERGSAGRYNLKRTNIENVSKAMSGETSGRRGGTHMGFSKRIDPILRAERNCRTRWLGSWTWRTRAKTTTTTTTDLQAHRSHLESWT